jgi:hypothetical protein
MEFVERNLVTEITEEEVDEEPPELPQLLSGQYRPISHLGSGGGPSAGAVLFVDFGHAVTEG